MALTEQQHAENEGGYCPFCNDNNIVGSELNIEGGVITQDVWCNECNKEWTDIFTLVGYQAKG